MKKAPHSGGAVCEYFNALNKPYSTPCRTDVVSQLIYSHACQGCGICFQTSTLSLAVCPTCAKWHEALTGIEITRKALREVR